MSVKLKFSDDLVLEVPEEMESYISEKDIDLIRAVGRGLYFQIRDQYTLEDILWFSLVAVYNYRDWERIKKETYIFNGAD